MGLRRGIILVMVTAAVATIAVMPCSADEKDQNDIWIEERPRGPEPRPGQGRGPRPGHRRWFEPTEEEINRVMKSLKESNPTKAKELAKLREKDPERFIAELREHGREEFGRVIRERIEKWRGKRRVEFLEWLGKTVPRKTRELAKLEDKDPDLYARKFEFVRRKYWWIFEESKRNRELAEVLMADMELGERQEVLVRKIKDARSEKEKKQLMSQLEEVVGNKYDLLIRRKQIAYERLLRRLEELQKELRESRDEIAGWSNKKIKVQNVKERIRYLLERTPKLRWR